MYCWRITKYDLKFRDIRGAYILDEWTDYSCVGMMIQGKQVTFEEYVEVEKKYIQAIRLFFDDLKLEELRFDFFLKYDDEQLDHHATQEMQQVFETISKETIVAKDTLVPVFQLILRGALGGILTNLEYATLPKGALAQNDFVVRFGFDYHMYVGVFQKHEQTIEKVKELGLFPELMEYYYSMGNILNPDDEKYPHLIYSSRDKAKGEA